MDEAWRCKLKQQYWYCGKVQEFRVVGYITMLLVYQPCITNKTHTQTNAHKKTQRKGKKDTLIFISIYT